jgi:two-component system, NtrC family, response regulator AtoC
MMPGIKGLDLITEVKKLKEDVGFLLISAYGTVEKAVDAMKRGAFDFITKPFSISQIESRVERYFEYCSLKEENKSLKRRLINQKLKSKLIGQGKHAKELFNNIEIVAKSDATVFIMGESGTGKELIAESIHDNSDRRERPFLKINCAAVPETLFESTLFGHEKGSFSGAYRNQKGIFEECDGGTLLLDEITEIPYNMQAKLLRVLQEHTITKVGSAVEIPVDVRIIATSNRDINNMVENSQFREDLFFRLNVFPITVPCLKERKEDIPLLVDHFLKVLKEKYNYEQKELSKEAMNILIQYDWPGNIRELENLLERAMLYSGKEKIITNEHIKFEVGSKNKNSDNNSVMNLAEMEKKLIFQALEKTNNHRNKAAELLGITVRTLRNKLHQFEQES